MTLVATLGFTLMALGLLFAKSGMWIMPNIANQYQVSQALTNTTASYVALSYLQPAIFGVFGGRRFGTYLIYCAVLTVGFVGVLFYTLVKTHGARWMMLCAVVFPVLAVPLYWIGMDGLTLGLMLAVSLSLGTRWVWLFGIALAWQHFEQGIGGFVLLALTLAAAQRWSAFRGAIEASAAIVAGKVALEVYLQLVGVVIVDGRLAVAHRHADEFFREWSAGWPLMLWSLLGAGWLILIPSWRLTWPLLVAIPGALGTLAVVGDQTRVGSIILFPALVQWVLLNREVWRRARPVWVTGALALHATVPFLFMWAGVPCGPIVGHTIRSGLDLHHTDLFRPFVVEGVCPSDMVQGVIRRLGQSAQRHVTQ